MPTIQHSVLTGADLHEPKGIGLASSDEVYVANGSGSGAWGGIYTSGWEQIINSESPITLTSGVWGDLTNNSSSTNTSNRLPGRSGVWSSGVFNWSAGGAQIGDTIEVVVDVEITASGTDRRFLFRLGMASGSIIPPDINMSVAGTESYTLVFPVFISNSSMLNETATLSAKSSGGGDSVKVNSFTIKTTPRKAVLA